MGSALLTAASNLVCGHGASAIPIGTDQRVTALGAPVLCVGDAVVVAGCAAVSPCLALELRVASRVLASGRPVAVAMATTSPPDGGYTVVVSAQRRAMAE